MKASTKKSSKRDAYLATLRRLETEQFEAAEPSTPVPGEIYLANAARFDESNFSQELTTYSVGWRDPNDIEGTRRLITPEVEVPPMFEYSEAINAEEFLLDGEDDIRALGSDFKVIEPYKAVKRLGKLENRGLTMVVDLDTVRTKPNWRQEKTAKLLRRIGRNRLRRGINLLSAAAINTAKTWNSAADPDADVQNEQLTATTLSGVGFNRALFGHTSWVKRWTAYRGQNNAGGYASAGMTPEQLAGSLALDRVIVSKERYQSTASAKAEIVGNLVLMFNAMDGADQDDPTNIKCFVGRPETEGGQSLGFYRVYEQRLSSKLVAITVEYYELQKITSTLGIRKFTVS